MKIKFFFRFILIIFLITTFCNPSNAQDESTEPETIKPADIHLSQGENDDILEITGISYNLNGDYDFDVQNSEGSTILTQNYLKEIGAKTLTAKNIGTINIEDSIDNIKSIFVENGNARINFMDGSKTTFEIDGKGYTFHSDGGYVEWKDGAMFLGKDTQMFTVDSEFNEVYASSNSDNLKIIVENGNPVVIIDENTDVFLSDKVILKDEKGDIIKSLSYDTHIKTEEGIPTVIEGKISVDYDTSPFKINLFGTYSSLELNTANNEKFEFVNTDIKNNLLVTIESIDKYMFHDGCKTNCISYREMGRGQSGEEWEKLKVDGNAKIVKYKDDEIGYSLTFSDGKATIGRKYLASMRDIPFNKKTVINYNNGDIELTSFTSQEDAMVKRSELNNELGSTIAEIKKASTYLKEKQEEFERLKKEKGYEDNLPEEMPEDLKIAKKALDDAELRLNSFINKKKSLIFQIKDITDTSLLIKGENTQGNINVLNLDVKEIYDSSLEKIWISAISWITEKKEIYDVDIARTFPNFPYLDEEIIYNSKEIRFDIYNKDPGITEEYSIYELAEKYSLKHDNIPILIALWKKESNFQPDVINSIGYIGLGQIQASSGAFSDVVSYYSNSFPVEYLDYARPVIELTQAEKSYINEELKKRDINAKVSGYYFNLMEEKYNLEKLEYQLMGYNAGPTATNEIINEFNRRGGGGWKDFKQFLFSDYSKLKLGYGYGLNAGEAKAYEVVDYVESISKRLGYQLT